jgi:hypothetical protein
VGHVEIQQEYIGTELETPGDGDAWVGNSFDLGDPCRAEHFPHEQDVRVAIVNHQYACVAE